jgi:hypothetical protein
LNIFSSITQPTNLDFILTFLKLTKTYTTNIFTKSLLDLSLNFPRVHLKFSTFFHTNFHKNILNFTDMIFSLRAFRLEWWFFYMKKKRRELFSIHFSWLRLLFISDHSARFVLLNFNLEFFSLDDLMLIANFLLVILVKWNMVRKVRFEFSEIHKQIKIDHFFHCLITLHYQHIFPYFTYFLAFPATNMIFIWIHS